MTVDPVNTHHEAKRHPAALAEPRIIDRRRITAPSIETPMPAGGSRVFRYSLVLAVLVLAGMANLTGAPPFLVIAMLAVGILGLLTKSREISRETNFASMVDAQSEKSRTEIETLADRMWELQESEERFRGLIDALGDLVVHRDREGRIVYANKVFADLMGYEQRALVNHSLDELGIEVGMVPDAAFSDGECLSSTDVAIRSSTGTRWFSWIELSVRDKVSNAVSHRAIARDITARKNAETALINARERAEFASQSKSRFLATVSHEIRTPMNGIMGMAKLLADTSLSPEQRTYVGAVSTSASALLALIEDLLDFSKIEAGRFELEPQPVSPRELVENVVELLASKAFAKNIGMGCHVAPDVPTMIVADPGRMRQVLLNLIGNAIKFTDCGGILVTVALTGPDTKRSIRFSVVDTGPGLQKADLSRIFEEFEQADGTSTRKHGGAGLGLAISRRIVDSMGGVLTVASESGKGSDFAFSIPARGITGPAAVSDDALQGRRVVILSHNAMEAEAITRTIRAYGGHVDVASTVAQAAGFVSGCDTVLVDAEFDKADGRSLARLRQAGFIGVEAITLIAPTDRGLLGEFRASGYSSFLARPVRGETLLRTMLAGKTQQTLEHAPAHNTPVSGGNVVRCESALTILIAEDNEINAMLARATLQKAGHTVEVVTNGKAAVDAIVGSSTHYDIILMDLHMPVMDGLDAIAAIRRYEEETGMVPMPIMVLSADSQEKTRHAVLAHGASGFVTKPLDPEVLVRAVEDQAAA